MDMGMDIEMLDLTTEPVVETDKTTTTQKKRKRNESQDDDTNESSKVSRGFEESNTISSSTLRADSPLSNVDDESSFEKQHQTSNAPPYDQEPVTRGTTASKRAQSPRARDIAERYNYFDNASDSKAGNEDIATAAHVSANAHRGNTTSSSLAFSARPSNINTDPNTHSPRHTYSTPPASLNTPRNLRKPPPAPRKSRDTRDMDFNGPPQPPFDFTTPDRRTQRAGPRTSTPSSRDAPSLGSSSSKRRKTDSDARTLGGTMQPTGTGYIHVPLVMQQSPPGPGLFGAQARSFARGTSQSLADSQYQQQYQEFGMPPENAWEIYNGVKTMISELETAVVIPCIELAKRVVSLEEKMGRLEAENAALRGLPLSADGELYPSTATATNHENQNQAMADAETGGGVPPGQGDYVGVGTGGGEGHQAPGRIRVFGKPLRDGGISPIGFRHGHPSGQIGQGRAHGGNSD